MSNTDPHVTCIGTATLDAIVVGQRPLPTDARIGVRQGAIAGGGPAATAAVALARQGIRTSFVGRVGDDEAGATVRRGLEREGIDVELVQVIPDGTTAFSAVVVDPETAGRLILTHAGSLPPLSADREILRVSASSDWVHVDQAGWAAARDLRSQGMSALLSVDGGNPIPAIDLSLVTLYAPSEAALLATSGERDIEAAMIWALTKGARLVVVTRGAVGSLAMGRFDLDAPDADAVLRQASPPAGRIVVVSEPAPKLAVLSTLGAGDVFHGILLAALCQGASVRVALKTANLGAAMSCASLDGRSAIPYRAVLALELGRA